MRLQDLAKKPELVEVTIDDEATIKEFGEPITFHTWDRAPLDIFTKLASANQNDQGEMIDIVRKMILDENGKEVMSKDNVLPPTLLLRSIGKIVEKLGN